MRILINKDGKQLGPFSVEQARVLVLAGQLDADDWAWPTGADDWIPLKDVPGFSPPAGTPLVKPAGAPVAAAAPVLTPAASPVAAPAASAGAATVSEEETLWSGHPSQVLNLAIYLFWGFFVLLAFGIGFVLADSVLWVAIVAGVVAAIATVQVAWAYLHLRAIEYVVSTQRVRIVSGLFSKDIKEIELFRVKDTMVRQSFFLRLFRLGTITILSGDERLPKLVLEGIPDAINLRERLRHEVMSLRQRFGVRELDVM